MLIKIFYVLWQKTHHLIQYRVNKSVVMIFLLYNMIKLFDPYKPLETLYDYFSI